MDNSSNSRKSSFLPKEIESLINFDDPSDLKIKNMLQMFNLGRTLATNDGNCIGHRPTSDSPFEWISYQEFYDLFTTCARGFDDLGISEGNEVNIISYSRLSKETFAIIFAGVCRRNVIVPLYDTLGKSSIEHIVNETSPSLAFCDSEQRARALLGVTNFNASHIITPFAASNELRSEAEALSIKLISFEELIKLGHDTESENHSETEATLDDVFYILYTSGSTGIPKGVVLCHRQFVFNIFSIIRALGSELDLKNGDMMTYYSYLPYQHVFENLVIMFILTIGGRIGISQGDLALIGSDLAVLKPKMIIAVPRVLDKFRTKILDSVSSANFIRRFIFNCYYNYRKWGLLRTNVLGHSFLDNIIFSKIHSIFGGSMKYLIVGGAPMNRDLEIFSRIVFGADLIHGYGLTETTAATLVQSGGNRGLCETGVPMPGVDIKLADFPEYEYYVKDGVGELCIRGPNVARGYFKRPDIDREAFDDDGFFHTGDIARINRNGSYTIIDRCKNIFKLSQGEYIMPEKIESVYAKHPLVFQIMIYGESTHNYFVGVVIVESPEVLAKFAADVTVEKDETALLEENLVKEKLICELKDIGKENDLLGFEQIKKVILSYKKFTVENELLTPTMKTRRCQVTKIYSREFQKLYSEPN